MRKVFAFERLNMFPVIFGITTVYTEWLIGRGRGSDISSEFSKACSRPRGRAADHDTTMANRDGSRPDGCLDLDPTPKNDVDSSIDVTRQRP